MYGSDRCLYELVKRIDKTRFIPVIVLPFKGVLADRLRALGVTVYITDPWVLRKGVFRSIKLIPYLLRLPVSLFRLVRIIRKEDISVVYSNTSVIIAAALAAFITRRPHIFHIREVYDDYPNISHYYNLFLCLLSKKIIAISKTVATIVTTRCVQKVNIIYDGIALDRFNTITSQCPDIISVLKQQNFVVVSNIGRISPMKGQELFISAVEKCLQHNKSLRFLIIGGVFHGNEPYLMRLQDMINKKDLKDIITFTGFRDDVDNFILNSDILVLSTIISEPLGQIVMEGMAAGKVFIAPDRGGPGELIEHGTDGILYMSGNSDALAQSLLRVANDPELRKSMGKKARLKAEKKFGIQSNIHSIERIIKEAASD